MISTKIHGYLDYIMGLTLILLPLILKISSGAASTILVVLGAGVIVYSLITDYELGLLKILAMKTHLIVDIIGGIFLVASPWLFGFADEIIWPFVILGALEIGAGLLTKKEPSYESHPNHHKGE
ncbi:SPW repeat domain-containing protein [Salinimicrobium xinjiangense]|uniref:SPW repeat domain-containing protein n=1 Tax=Salinimicrobium xinjiangense TaxID=438596 RepID=UPI000419604E|nr:SPW repeat protein [Salinimicrobium xinjiangense]